MNITTPLYNFPHTEVVINDNSQSALPNPITIGGTRMICVFQSPRGEDNKIQTVTTGLPEFIKKFGMGPIAKYGQPLLNAYNAVSTNSATLYCMRVMPKDAARANLHIYAAYKVDTASDEEDKPWNSGGTKKKMIVKFLTSTTSGSSKSALELVSTGEGSPAETAKPTDEGFTIVHLFSIACSGRGAYGNTIAVRLVSDTRSDRGNEFKNYFLQVLENNEIVETASVCFYDDAIYGDINKAADVVVNDTESGLDNIIIGVNYDGFYEIVEKYNTEVLKLIVDDDTALAAYAKYLKLETKPNQGKDIAKERATLNIKDFDILLGVNKNLASTVSDMSLTSIVNYEISPSSSDGVNPVINLNEIAGNLMKNGTDGEFGDGPGESLDDFYISVFNGEVDPDIRSRNKYPTDVILDANYSNKVKISLAALAVDRGDCICYLDCGTNLTSKSSPLNNAAEIDISTVNRLISIDGYKGKMRDPDSRRIIEVTSTAALASSLPIHFQNYNGKHIPFAGGRYGQLTGFIPGSVFPAYDEDIDSEIMASLYEARINYAQINPKGLITRATQQTRQEILSNLSELSNMHIILDIKRDCENLVALYNYNFLNPQELAAFNKDAQELLRKYSDTQVEAISASFESTDLEEEQGVLHLYVDVRQKKLIKTAMIDINVNK